MDITRRKFFFFGLAAGVGLFLPDSKIELVWDTIRVDYFIVEEKRKHILNTNPYRASRQLERMLYFNG